MNLRELAHPSPLIKLPGSQNGPPAAPTRPHQGTFQYPPPQHCPGHRRSRTSPRRSQDNSEVVLVSKTMIEPRVRPISQHLFAKFLPFMQFGPQWEMQNPTPECIDSQLLVQGKTLLDQTVVLCSFMLLPWAALRQMEHLIHCHHQFCHHPSIIAHRLWCFAGLTVQPVD